MFSFFHSSTQTLVPWLVKWGGKRVEWNWWYFWVAIVLWANKMNAGSERPMCPWRQTSLCLFNSVDHVKNFERFLIPSKLWLSICVNMGLRRWAGELWVFCEYSFASLKNPVGPRWKLLNLKTFGIFFFFFYVSVLAQMWRVILYWIVACLCPGGGVPLSGEVSAGLAASWPCKPVHSLGVCYRFPLIQSGNSCDLQSPPSELYPEVHIWPFDHDINLAAYVNLLFHHDIVLSLTFGCFQSWCFPK